jgi:hypothetical protein
LKNSTAPMKGFPPSDRAEAVLASPASSSPGPSIGSGPSLLEHPHTTLVAPKNTENIARIVAFT